MAKRAITEQAKALKAQTILDKAAEMFLSSEYDKIKMSEIAKALNVSNGILFYYFKTKEALFFNLLCREYEKRLSRLTEIARESQINAFADFKNLVMKELVELIDTSPLYIRLEAMRTAILEKNVDADTMLKMKTSLYMQMMEMVAIICRNSPLNQEVIMDVLQAEVSIITGCKLSATLPPEVIDIIEKNGLEDLKRDFRKDVIETMKHYLDGYALANKK